MTSFKIFKIVVFSRSVVSDDCDALPALDFEIQILEKRLSREGFGEVLDGQHIVSACDARFQTDPHIGAYFGRLFQHIHFVQHFFTALGAFDGFLAVERFQLCNDFFLMVDFLLLVDPGMVSGFTEHCFFLTVGGIVSLKSCYFFIVHFNDFCDNAVEKVTVMGDDQDGSAVI